MTCSFCNREALMIFGDAAVCEEHDMRSVLHEPFADDEEEPEDLFWDEDEI